MKYLLFIAGAILTALAFFSFQLGLDNDTGWGRGRIVLLIAGMICIALSAAIHFLGTAVNNAFRKWNDFIEYRLDRRERIRAAAVIATLAMIASYFWFTQLDERIAGYEFEYYIETAKSFKNGRLHLAVEPPADLLALENPYDYFQRKQAGVDNFPWDLSLYDGNFYIYWGPTPALLASLLSRDLLNKLGDFHLALAFACGLFIYQVLIVSTYWQRSLKRAPAWLMGILLLVGGLMTPTLLMLYGAKVSDAALFSCQFFLIGGCYWAYLALQDESPSAWKLALAAAHWILSIGSRVIVLPGVMLCAGLALLFVFRYFKGGRPGAIMPAVIGLATPFLIGGGAIAWYNQARFDSIFEFGLTYQLASVDYTNFKNIFSISRISTNAGLYLAHPLRIMPRFPYLAPIEYVNSNERLAGLIFTAPYIILLGFQIIGWNGNRVFFQGAASDSADGRKIAGSWLSYSLLGSSLIATLIIFSYYHPAMRFIEDFTPALAVVITIQTGLQYDNLQDRSSFRRKFTALVLFLAGITIVANTLLAMPNDGTRFAVNFLNDISKLLGLK